MARKTAIRCYEFENCFVLQKLNYIVFLDNTGEIVKTIEKDVKLWRKIERSPVCFIMLNNRQLNKIYGYGKDFPLTTDENVLLVK